MAKMCGKIQGAQEEKCNSCHFLLFFCSNLLLVWGECNVDLCEGLYELGHDSLADPVKHLVRASFWGVFSNI